jgi:Ca2+-binding EF-hand superfamily protein
MKALTITAAVLALGVAAPAVAGTAGMAKMDADGDGKVSLSEMQASKVARTMRLDANGDGLLTKAEYAARMMPRYEARGLDKATAQAKIDRLFTRTDLNHDGFLSPDEIRQFTARRFARVDPQGSGYIPATNTHRQLEPAPSSTPR